MFRRILLVLTLLVLAKPVLAQDIPLPKIVSFTADPASVILSEVENGTAEVTLSWRVFYPYDEFYGKLEVYGSSEWATLSEGTFKAIDSIKVSVNTPHNFAPITFRLTVIVCYGCPDGGNGRAETDHWILTIPYADVEQAEPPTIESFTTDVESVPGYFDYGPAVRLSWKVNYRTSTTDLVFEHLLPDDTVMPFHPYYSEWIRSEGTSDYMPTRWQLEGTARIRLRIVDVITDEIYDEAEVTVQIIKQSYTPAPTSSVPVVTLAPPGP
jgi:hypothetical protein